MNLFISPIDKEVSWDKTIELVSKTDQFGTIKFCNENFVNISGYEDYELVGNPHNIIRHPDMPKVLFKVLWDHISTGKDFNAVVKNLSKSGRFYWVITQFEIIKNENGVITGYICRRKGVDDNTVRHFERLYIKLKKIEDQVSIEAAEEYLNGFLEEAKLNYNEYLSKILESDAYLSKISEPLNNEPAVKSKNFFRRIFR